MFLTFFTNTAIGRWFAANAIKMISALVLIALAFIAYAQYKHVERERDQANQKIGEQVAEIANQKKAIAALNDQLLKKQQSQEVTTKTETEVAAGQRQVEVRYKVVVKTVHDAVAVVEADPKLTDDQKSTAESKIYIDQLWTSFCSDTNNSSPTCSDYPDSTPAKTSQLDNSSPAQDLRSSAVSAEETPDPNYT